MASGLKARDTHLRDAMAFELLDELRCRKPCRQPLSPRAGGGEPKCFLLIVLYAGKKL